MRKLLILLVLAAGACAKRVPEDGLPSGVYKAGARDALCIAKRESGQRAGLIVYGADGANCSVSGRLERAADGYVLVPAGEGGCRIGLSASGSSVAIGSVPGTCSYYCGPGATMAGKSFTGGPDAKVTDFAGDPLC